MSKAPVPINLDNLRHVASRPDEMGNIEVTGAFLRRVLYELEHGRAAELELIAIRNAPLIAEYISPRAGA